MTKLAVDSRTYSACQLLKPNGDLYVRATSAMVKSGVRPGDE